MERYSDRAIEIINELHTERLDYESEYLPLIDCAQRCADYENTDLTPERTAELADAQGAGRLAVLPPDRTRWLKEILAERERQDQKWGYPQENTYCEWSSILGEEAGELAKELNELNFGRGNPDRMNEEAVQVAAVALSILEQSAVAHGVTAKANAALGRAHAKPGCFYGADELCPGMSFNNDDEPIENCKQCRWCSAGYFQLEAEAMVRENGGHLNQTKS